jgi:hypothetical protein
MRRRQFSFRFGLSSTFILLVFSGREEDRRKRTRPWTAQMRRRQFSFRFGLSSPFILFVMNNSVPGSSEKGDEDAVVY